MLFTVGVVLALGLGLFIAIASQVWPEG